MLNGKVIFITGGAGLLGREFVKTVLEQSGVALIGDIEVNNAQPFLEEIRKKYGKNRAELFQVDICSKDSLSSLIEKADKQFGRIDAVLSNAYPRNKNYGRVFEKVELSDFNENVSMHLGGYFLTSQLFAEYFKKKGGGNLVFVSSIYGFLPPRFEIYEGCGFTMPVEYAVIKAGIIQLAKYIAKCYKGCHIRSNCVSPGGILNGQNEDFVKKYNSFGLSKGMLDKTDLNGTIIYLLSDASKYLNGQNIVLDDGFTL
ncbi:MAG: SDR family oxidoreductase [Candidatus Riflebacteria bacterium]|nr:SDR family oxidoreductase [Candidatus Riflebacteria bacterium]